MFLKALRQLKTAVRVFRWCIFAAAATSVLAVSVAAALSLIPVVDASTLDQLPQGEFQPGVVLVKFKPLVFPLVADGIVSLHGYRTLRTSESLGIRQVAVTPGQEADAIATLKNDPLVEYAEPDYARQTLWVPDDAYYESDQWNLRKINMEAAWDISRGSPSIKVAVVDTGLDMSQPDHATNIVSPFNECTGDSNISDDDGHGTHVSGIIAANTNNGIGIAGVAPNISLMPIRVQCPDSNGNETIYVSTEIDAIEYAADHGARVISISLGGQTWENAEQDAVNYALSKGAMVVAAAGNEYQSGNPPSYPAGYPGVVAVAATDSNDNHASYSDEQPYVTVAAPGGDGSGSDPSQWVLSTYLGSSYAYMAGTSQATPHVSGLAGLIWSVNPALTSLQVTSIITSTAVDLGAPGRDNTFGWGRIDAFAALTKAQQTLPTPTPTATPTPTTTPIPGLAPATTSTPVPDLAPTATPTAIPTATSEPLPTPSPTASSAPAYPSSTPPASSLSRQTYLPLLPNNSSSW